MRVLRHSSPPAARRPPLVLPHPLLAERAFVLVPLADIAPDLVHPVLRRTMAELWGEFPDQDAGLEPIEL